MNEKEIITKSKFLSLILRHKPEEVNLKLDKNGWANINELIDKCRSKGIELNFNQLRIIVETNNKKRFTFNEDFTKIRANQGHSIEVDVKLEEIKPPEFLYHGTSEKNLELILESGIKKMNRLHVHLSSEKITAEKVGQRHGKPIIFIINTNDMYKDGIKFYLSKNNVWLTDYIAPKYIKISDN